MPSSFAWVDFSELDRKATQEVLDLLKEQDTRDELGIGSVRDALADTLFPGTSTLHTRARYFLFIPWIYLRLVRRKASGSIAQLARDAELRLIEPLSANDDKEGVIGLVAEDGLKRLPSSMYWAGLASWGIRRFPGSQSHYHRLFVRLHSGLDATSSEEDGAASGSVWDPGLPKAPDDFPAQASLALTREEASYLRHRIDGLGNTLLGHLVRTRAAWEAQPFPWARSDATGWPEPFVTQISHARCFSEVIHGSALLYNLLLAELLKDDDLVANYRAAFGEWANLIELRRPALREWNRAQFWRLVATKQPRVTLRARQFIDGWLDLVGSTRGQELAAQQPARSLVEQRERQLKRGRSRFANEGARARWGGASGAAQVNYRWNRVQRLVADIRAGLGRA